MSEYSQEARKLLDKHTTHIGHIGTERSVMCKQALAAIQEVLTQRDAFKQEAIRLMGPFASEANCWACGNDERVQVKSWAESKPIPSSFTVGDLRAIAQFVKENDNGAA